MSRRGEGQASVPPTMSTVSTARVTELEQHTAEQRRQLSENDNDLDATRATNRELMTRLNRLHPDGCNH